MNFNPDYYMRQGWYAFTDYYAYTHEYTDVLVDLGPEKLTEREQWYLLGWNAAVEATAIHAGVVESVTAILRYPLVDILDWRPLHE